MITDPFDCSLWLTDGERRWLDFYDSLPPDVQEHALKLVVAMVDAKRRFMVQPLAAN